MHRRLQARGEEEEKSYLDMGFVARVVVTSTGAAVSRVVKCQANRPLVELGSWFKDNQLHDAKGDDNVGQ